MAAGAWAQTGVIDRLKQQLSTEQADKERMGTVFAICEQQLSLYPDSSFRYSLWAKELAAKAGTKQDKHQAEYFIATALWRAGQVDTALQLIDRELAANPVADPASRELFFRLTVLKIRLLTTNAKMKEAGEAIYSLLNEAEKHNDTLNQIIAYTSIGVLKRRSEKNPQEALNWFLKAAKLASADKKYESYSILYGNLARMYSAMGKNDSANYYIRKGVDIARNTQNLPFLQTCLTIQSDIFSNTGRMEEAEKALKESIALSRLFNKDTFYVDDIRQLADFYVKTAQYQKGIELCTRYLATDTVPEYRIMYLQPLATCYKMTGNMKMYGQTLEELIDQKDLFYKQDQARSSAELQTRYEVQKKENTIIQQKLDLSRKNYILYGTLLLLAFAAILGWILFYNYRKRQKLKTELLLQKEKDSSLLAVAKAEEGERKRIAADLHDNLGTYAASIVSNLDFIRPDTGSRQSITAMQELRHNSLAIVSQLSDTIWVLNKNALSLTSISDRLKTFINRVQPSFPAIAIHIGEDIGHDHLLPPSQAYHLFQIVQEAVNNALRHSQCRHIDIFMESKETSWRVSIADDGKGMQLADNKRGGNGLTNMKSRADESGWLISWSNADPQGTVVTISPQASPGAESHG